MLFKIKINIKEKWTVKKYLWIKIIVYNFWIFKKIKIKKIAVS